MKAPKDIRILVVDDDAALRDAIVFEFTRKGFQVFSAESGNQAYAQLKAEPVDVVVTDVRMADGTGIELLDRVKAGSPEMPIVMLVTGFSDLGSDQAYDKGAEAIFSKPFNRKELVSEVLRLVSPRAERWNLLAGQVDVSLQMSLTVTGKPENQSARMLSLGRGGMFVELDPKDHRFPRVDDTVSFRSALAGGLSVEGCGVVRWVRMKATESLPAGCGIEFTFLSDGCKAAIIGLIESSQPKAFIPRG